MKPEDWADVLNHVFVSPNVSDSNLEPANLVDTTAAISNALHHVAKALEEINETIMRKG